MPHDSTSRDIRPLRHTSGHIDCPACELARTRMIEPGALANLKFSEAAPVWLEGHAQVLSPASKRDYECSITALNYFFCELSLRQIHVGHFEQYQKLRRAGEGGFPRAAGPSRVNHELNTLSQVLSRAGLWTLIAPHYKPLRLPRPRVGCAMVAEDEARLFRIAASNPRWKVAYCCSLITAHTTAGPNEIRHLRLGDIDLSVPAIHITEGVKNEYRRRDVPLNEASSWAIDVLLRRAEKIGATRPEHYLLPHRAPNGQKGFDPSRPISSWRGAWDRLRKAANLPHLRMYDLRHHSITLLLEDESVSERTVIEIAGHVSRAMLDRYSHIRMRTKKEAVDTLAKRRPQGTGPAKLVLIKK